MDNIVNDNLWIEFPTKVKVSVSDMNKVMKECGLDSSDNDVVQLVYNFVKPSFPFELDFSEINKYEDGDEVVSGFMNCNSVDIFEKSELIKYVETNSK